MTCAFEKTPVSQDLAKNPEVIWATAFFPLQIFLSGSFPKVHGFDFAVETSVSIVQNKMMSIFFPSVLSWNFVSGTVVKTGFSLFTVEKNSRFIFFFCPSLFF